MVFQGSCTPGPAEVSARPALSRVSGIVWVDYGNMAVVLDSGKAKGWRKVSKEQFQQGGLAQ